MSDRVRKLERMLDTLDEVDYMEHEEKVDFIITLLEERGFFRDPGALKTLFKHAYMQQPEVLDLLLDHYRDKWTKELREALKQARKEGKIERK